MLNMIALQARCSLSVQALEAVSENASSQSGDDDYNSRTGVGLHMDEHDDLTTMPIRCYVELERAD